MSAVQAMVMAATLGLAASGALAQDIPADAVNQANTIWKDRCATCHGALGKGDGALGMQLQPKPRDLTLAAWQSSVTDEHIEKVIAGGGQSVGLSMLMPANPDIVSKPDVIKALRAHVRSLAAK